MVSTQQTVSKGGGEPALPSQFGGNKEGSLSEDTSIKLKQKLLRMSQQNNSPFENVCLEKKKKKQYISVLVCSFYGVMRNFTSNLYHVFGWAIAPYRVTKLKFACFVFKFCRPLELLLFQSVLREVC